MKNKVDNIIMMESTSTPVMVICFLLPSICFLMRSSLEVRSSSRAAAPSDIPIKGQGETKRPSSFSNKVNPLARWI